MIIFLCKKNIQKMAIFHIRTISSATYGEIFRHLNLVAHG